MQTCHSRFGLKSETDTSLDLCAPKGEGEPLMISRFNTASKRPFAPNKLEQGGIFAQSGLVQGSSPSRFRGGRRRRGVTRVIVIVAVVLLVTVAAAAMFFRKPSEVQLSLENAIVAEVFQGEFKASVVETGDLESSKSVEIRCRVKSKGRGGTAILKIVPEGTRVEEGDFLAQLDDSILRDELTQQKIQVATDKANVIQAENDLATAKSVRKEYENGAYGLELATIQSELALAKETHRRAIKQLTYITRLAVKGYATDTQLEADTFAVEKATTDLKIATDKLSLFEKFTGDRMLAEMDAEIRKQEANKEAAEFTLELSKQRLAEFESQVAACRITAPSAGMVVYANEMDRRGNSTVIIEEGAMLRDGQEIFRLPDPSQMQVLTTVNDSKINDIFAGQPAIIRLDTDPDKQYEGQVVKVAKFPLPRRWYQAPIEYEVWVKINKPTEETRPGLRGKVEIMVSQEKNKIQAPISSLVKREEEYYVLVKNGSELEARNVKIGINIDQHVIIESGLEPGEKVLIDPDKFVELTSLETANP